MQLAVLVNDAFSLYVPVPVVSQPAPLAVDEPAMAGLVVQSAELSVFTSQCHWLQRCVSSGAVLSSIRSPHQRRHH